ncbi:DUF411 domain-containing protein [Rhodobacteraceae bacterium 2CG4]|uniref:DUF411 domain-containing protein n=1 Tax=Halovulum marinum TaxID=2662447 RepID=A0A6L5Z0K3_9RHOB|nr:DUF411 domain-containing protein [Halovulum marinum]MSU89504.1 DUF411 domain-containing protein [Halovulum marinum]
MPNILTRRAVLTSAGALALALVLPRPGRAAVPAIHVMKDPNCGCCAGWIEILEAEGFDVTTEAAVGAQLARYKLENGIPAELASCHTGKVEGYVIEGHVPVADIRRLLSERPEAVGLAVPGMPYGSPGMGPEDQREAFDVLLVRAGGESEVFTRYDAA